MNFKINLDVGGAKDKTLSKLLLASARQYLKEFGEVLDLTLDTKARIIVLEALPVGEREPIRVEVAGYGLVTDAAGAGWLTFERLTASREWLSRVAAAALPQRKLRLPSGTPMGLLNTLL